MERLYILVVVCSFLLVNSASAQFLVEAFRNFDCLNCKVPDGQYEAYLATKPEYKAEIVYIHNNFPLPTDSFYLAAHRDIDARSGTMYKIQADPHVFVSGISAGSSFSTWKSQTDQTAAAISYPVVLTVTGIIQSDGKVAVHFHTEGSTAGIAVKPFAMLVESKVQFNNTGSYGNPSDGNWNNIFRAMIPTKDGGDVVTPAGSMDIPTFIYDPTGKPWVLANCKIVCFLQEVNAQSDGVSHKIDAFAVAPLITAGVSGSEGNAASSIGTPIPNPSVSSAQIPFHLAAPANVKIVVCDDLGREVATIFDQFAEGSSFATFMPNTLSRGIYYARMFADGSYIGMQKIVFAP